MTEEELKKALNSAQKGDQRAFALIYDHFSHRLYNFIYFRVGHKEVAEDILSDTFVKAWTKMAQISALDAFSGWLYQIAKNNVIDYYRVKKTVVDLEEVVDTLEDAVNPIDEASLGIEQARVLEVLEHLPTDQQQVIKYKFFEDLSNQEIAYIMNKTEGAIRVIQHRAILKLQGLFKKRI